MTRLILILMGVMVGIVGNGWADYLEIGTTSAILQRSDDPENLEYFHGDFTTLEGSVVLIGSIKPKEPQPEFVLEYESKPVVFYPYPWVNGGKDVSKQLDITKKINWIIISTSPSQLINYQYDLLEEYEKLHSTITVRNVSSYNAEISSVICGRFGHKFLSLEKHPAESPSRVKYFGTDDRYIYSGKNCPICGEKLMACFAATYPACNGHCPNESVHGKSECQHCRLRKIEETITKEEKRIKYEPAQ